MSQSPFYLFLLHNRKLDAAFRFERIFHGDDVEKVRAKKAAGHRCKRILRR